MGQQDVLEYLEQQEEWKTTTEIAEYFGMNRSSISTSLAKLFEQEIAKRRRVVKDHHFYFLWRIK